MWAFIQMVQKKVNDFFKEIIIWHEYPEEIFYSEINCSQ